MNDEANITRINMVLPMLNEDQKRMYFASEASAIDRGGITCISNLTGVSRVTITAGIKDLFPCRQPVCHMEENTC